MRDGLAAYYTRVVASAQRAFTELRAVAKANQKVLGAKGPNPNRNPNPNPNPNPTPRCSAPRAS